MSNRPAKYLFVYDQREDRFPERWRIVRRGDPAGAFDISELTGTLNESHVDDMRQQLQWTYPKPRYDVSTASAKTWSEAGGNYRGLRDHDDIPRAKESAGAPAATQPKDRRRDRRPTRRDSSPAPRSRPLGLRDRWLKLLLALYLLTALVGAAILIPALAALPAELPRFELSEDQDVQAEARRIREWVAVEIPAAADWLAPMGLFNVDDDLSSVLAPNDWELENVSLALRIERLNRSIESIQEDYLNAASLLGAVFVGGFFFALLAFVRPNLGTAFAVFLFPLFTTPIATEPLINRDNMSLFYLTLPMLITGGGVLLIESARAIWASVLGPRSEAWARVWLGLWMIAVGVAATTVSALLSEALNAGLMMVALGPIVFGVFSVLWGMGGLLRRR